MKNTQCYKCEYLQQTNYTTTDNVATLKGAKCLLHPNLKFFAYEDYQAFSEICSGKHEDKAYLRNCLLCTHCEATENNNYHLCKGHRFNFLNGNYTTIDDSNCRILAPMCRFFERK